MNYKHTQSIYSLQHHPASHPHTLIAFVRSARWALHSPCIARNDIVAICWCLRSYLRIRSHAYCFIRKDRTTTLSQRLVHHQTLTRLKNYKTFYFFSPIFSLLREFFCLRLDKLIVSVFCDINVVEETIIRRYWWPWCSQVSRNEWIICICVIYLATIDQCQCSRNKYTDFDELLANQIPWRPISKHRIDNTNVLL